MIEDDTGSEYVPSECQSALSSQAPVEVSRSTQVLLSFVVLCDMAVKMFGKLIPWCERAPLTFVPETCGTATSSGRAWGIWPSADPQEL